MFMRTTVAEFIRISERLVNVEEIVSIERIPQGDRHAQLIVALKGLSENNLFNFRLT